MITLSQAISSGKLADFIEQEEKRGVGPAPTAEVEKAIRLLAKRKQSAGRTSRSASGDGSDET